MTGPFVGWLDESEQIQIQTLITGRTGSVSYTRQETHTMTEPTPEEATLAELQSLKVQLDKRITQLTNAIRQRQIPTAPAMNAGNMYQVLVKYAAGGTNYKFLIYRAPEGTGWYTTGNQGDNGYFATWRELVEWLRGPDIYWHSNMERLMAHSDTVILAAERPNS